ncbi:pyruvate transporter mpc1, partial [Xylographa soralifera]|nr:pyruvate transporter mpc1 [Xylographa soralifera]
MAAAISALNAKIRSQPVLNYVCSTHFWGPVSNFGIPIAAVMDTKKDPEIISGKMTAALTLYSGTFMRYSLAVTPKNYLLFACHFVNFGAQLTQGYRYIQYWNYGGKEARAQGILNSTKNEAVALAADGKEMLSSAKDK